MRKCCWEVLVIELLVVIWFVGRQACCLAWVNLSFRSLFQISVSDSDRATVGPCVGNFAKKQRKERGIKRIRERRL